MKLRIYFGKLEKVFMCTMEKDSKGWIFDHIFGGKGSSARGMSLLMWQIYLSILWN